ncbi:hypothetical protein HCU64_21420 [Methylobacterium sp. C25]|uniref:hypothetical protein n=1 Tax=Methylobacterium sp. C25 TaxID=2721622 RepID=UPI001F250E4D|nr:hypothetical protein [Methylobacterium sp. C25]MCE4226313.1 hypothetical protein [Methylobacterium sp. C25]
MAHDLTLARSHAYHLARTLMVCILLFQSDSGYGVMPSDEFDGDPASVILEFDPFA